MPVLSRETTQSVTIAADTRDAEFTLATCHPPLAVRFVDAVDGTPVRATEMLVVDGEVDGPPSGSGRGGRDAPTRGIASLSADGMRGAILLSPPRGHPTGDDRMPREQQSERFRLIVDARDHARTRLGPFDPEKLSTTEPLTLALERGRQLHGTVRDGRRADPGARARGRARPRSRLQHVHVASHTAVCAARSRDGCVRAPGRSPPAPDSSWTRPGSSLEGRRQLTGDSGPASSTSS
jgi:hypothetical protein